MERLRNKLRNILRRFGMNMGQEEFERTVEDMARVEAEMRTMTQATTETLLRALDRLDLGGGMTTGRVGLTESPEAIRAWEEVSLDNDEKPYREGSIDFFKIELKDDKTGWEIVKPKWLQGVVYAGYCLNNCLSRGHKARSGAGHSYDMERIWFLRKGNKERNRTEISIALYVDGAKTEIRAKGNNPVDEKYLGFMRKWMEGRFGVEDADKIMKYVSRARTGEQVMQAAQGQQWQREFLGQWIGGGSISQQEANRQRQIQDTVVIDVEEDISADRYLMRIRLGNTSLTHPVERMVMEGLMRGVIDEELRNAIRQSFGEINEDRVCGAVLLGIRRSRNGGW